MDEENDVCVYNRVLISYGEENNVIFRKNRCNWRLSCLMKLFRIRNINIILKII